MRGTGTHYGEDRRGAGRTSPSWILAVSLMVVSLVAAIVVGLTACESSLGGRSVTTGDTAATSTSIVDQRPTVSANIVAGGDGLVSPATEVARTLGPSVVNIKCTFTVAGRGYFGVQERESVSEGSGVIYAADGMIVTNAHVVTDEYGRPADDVKAVLATGEELQATIVGIDLITDLAVVKAETDSDLPAATFVTDLPRVGDYVVVIGNAYGLENTVSLGIVSGLDRTVGGVGEQRYYNLIQTDAAISSGNSGGAMANVRGQVLGVPSVAFDSVQGLSIAENIGFAIPSAQVTRVAEQIIATGKATHAFIGITTVTITAELQEYYELPRSSGELVYELWTGGPAEKAGIQEGDYLIEIDGIEMTEEYDLQAVVLQRSPGDKLQVTVDRDGVTQSFEVTLEERPADY